MFVQIFSTFTLWRAHFYINGALVRHFLRRCLSGLPTAVHPPEITTMSTNRQGDRQWQMGANDATPGTVFLESLGRFFLRIAQNIA